jgi:hypothetical protein
VRWGKDQDVRILMLGIDSAGKVRHIHPAQAFKLNIVRNHVLDHNTVPTAGVKYSFLSAMLSSRVYKIGEVVSTIPSACTL